MAGATRVRRRRRGGARGRAGRRPIERTPGRPDVPRRRRPSGMRLREVEIHHADLDAGYTHRDWPPEFSRAAARRDGQAGRVARAVPGRTRPTSTGTWSFGEGGPTVSGTGRRPRLVAHRPRRRRGTDQRQRRTAEDRGMVTYTGEVKPGGAADIRELSAPDRHQGRGRPGDVQQLLPAALQRDRRPGADRRRRRAGRRCCR